MEKDILQTKIVFTSFIVQTDFGQDNHMSLDLNPVLCNSTQTPLFSSNDLINTKISKRH